MSTASASSPQHEAAAEQVAKFQTYSKQVSVVLWRGAALAGLLVAMAAYLRWVASLGPAQTRVSIEIGPIDAVDATGVLAVIAAIAVAVQVAVRAPLSDGADRAAALARRKYLSAFSGVVVVAAFTVAGLAALSTVTTPSELDVPGLYGPLALAVGVAVVAADAATASGPEYTSPPIQEAWREARRENIRAALQAMGRPVSTTRLWRVLQGVVLIGLPLAVPAVFALAWRPKAVFWALLVVVGVNALALACSGAMIQESAVLRAWFEAVSQALFGTLLAALFVLSILSAALSQSAETSFGDGARLVILALSGPFLSVLLTASSLRGGNSTRPDGVLRYLVRRSLERRLARLERAAPAKPPVSPLAWLALGFAAIFPLGLVVGNLAAGHIRAANEAQVGSMRGMRIVRIAQVGNWVVFAAMSAVALLLLWLATFGYST